MNLIKKGPRLTSVAADGVQMVNKPGPPDSVQPGLEPEDKAWTGHQKPPAADKTKEEQASPGLAGGRGLAWGAHSQGLEMRRSETVWERVWGGGGR